MKVAANIQTAQQLQKQPLDSQEAARRLLDIERQLTDSNGRIKSGYLRLTRSGSLNAGHFPTCGSLPQATLAVREMIKQAYGDRLGPKSAQRLEMALDLYLMNSWGAIGTRSFVKLIRSLESAVRVDADLSPVGITSRLGLPELKSREIEVREEIDASVVQFATRRGNPISSSAIAQFQSLANAMSWSVEPIAVGDQVLTWDQQFAAFNDLMFPAVSALSPALAIGGAEAPRTFAMGDADGSMGRMVLHAIASGVAELPSEQMPALARLMNREISASLDLDNGLKNYQADLQVSRDLDSVADALVVRPKPHQDDKPACIFLGDILSDRLTNNQEAMARFIYKLSGFDPQNPGARADSGVRFIAGNHDTMPLLGPDGNDSLKKSADWTTDWGVHATKKLPLAQYQKLLADCFRAADYSDGVLTTHNGVVKGEGANEYLVGAGSPRERNNYKDASGGVVSDCLSLKADNPQELARKMNEAFLDRVNTAGPRDVISTDFRPADNLMTPSALGFDAAGFRQLHGHNADANESHAGVTNLNARGEGALGRFKPTGRILTYAVPAPSA
jgi:hypothetical protein